jgi:hypothetical protein
MPLQAPFGEYAKLKFVIQQSLMRMQTSTLVKVVACTNDGDLSPVGFVDIIPLVNQTDSESVGTEHTTIFNVPYLRMQGGSNAIILDPEVGDIGIAVFASRDISKVKATKNNANPGSKRVYNYSDAMYIGGMLNGTPNQYVQFSSNGIIISSPEAVELIAPVIEIKASERYTWDVSGYGEDIIYNGGTNWTHVKRHIGAHVTTENEPIGTP